MHGQTGDRPGHRRDGRRAGRRPATIIRVVVEIGKLAAVLPDALRFSFDVASEGTAAGGASLEVIETSGQELRVRQMEVI